MAQRNTGYARKNWKKWVGIYLAAAAIVYFVVYLALFAHGSGGGGGIY